MLFAAVLVGVLAFVNAHGGNFGNGGWNMGMGQMGMGQMGMGQMGMGQMGMGQMGMGQMGMSNQVGYLLQLLGGGRQMGGQGQMGGNMGRQNQMGGNMGGMGNQGMMGGVMLLLLQNLLQNRGNQGDMDSRMDKEEMEGVEELMKQKMMMEMADMMYVYMNFKEKEEEFKQAMEFMCFMVNATYEAYRRNETEVFRETDDAMMKQLGMEVENMNSKDQMDFAINMFNNNMQKYSEIFLRFATWACMTGDSMMESYMKMEKMNKGEGHC